MGRFFSLYCFFQVVMLLLSFQSATAQGSDTAVFSLPELQQRFRDSNFQLIAAKYQVEAAKADVITARLFDNPEVSYENVLYNPETKRFLGTSLDGGQYQASLAQVLKLAGKRNKNIQLAVSGVRMADYQYFDLMRSLRFELGSSFYKAYYLQQSAKVYDQQISSLKLLLGANEQQLRSGNIAQKDVIRIKSLLYSLQAEYNTLQNDLEDLLTRLKLMTNLPAQAHLLLRVPESESNTYQPESQSYALLLDSARNNRADLLLSRAGLQQAGQNLKLQQANAVPDVELSLTYDQQGSYIQRYSGIGLKIPLPLFNRNQGEIKKAKIAIEAANVVLKSQEAVLENEVSHSFQAALRIEQLFAGLDKNFSRDFDRLILQVMKNFSSRNISLIEFLDFYDAFRSSTLQVNNILYERMNAKEELNYVTGSTIYR